MNNKPVAYQIKQNHSVVVFVDGKLITVGKDDLNYDIVLECIANKSWDQLRSIVSIKDALADMTDGQVEIFGDDVYVAKKKLPVAISSRIVDLLKVNKFDLKPMFRLLENIEKNPEEFSRNELYLFLEHNSLPFTEDGHFLAYKMVRSDYMDIYSGTLRNAVGDVVSVPRETVDKNRHNTCSSGLHFCSYDYLSHAYVNGPDYRLMVVKINPADVVSIPSDYNNSKGRCWKYEVVDEIGDKSDSLDKNFTKKHSKLDEIKKIYEDTAEEPVAVNTSAKLTVDKVKSIKIDLTYGDGENTLAYLARKYGVSARQIARIRDGEAWADVPWPEDDEEEDEDII